MTRKHLLASSGVSVLCFFSAALGQTVGNGLPSAGPVPDTSTRSRLETIVVTAQKRSEVVQKVPAAIATVSPQTLSRAGVRDFDQLEKVLPDVHVDDAGASTNISIRGVRESATGPTSDSPVAVHLDGVYLSRPTSLSGLFYDLARIEELPGPQGTLYGRNATGGVLNLITNRPGGVFGGYLESEGGSYGLYRFNGALNLPLSDAVSVRAAFHILHNDGYFSDGFDNTDQKGGRLSVRARLSEDATLLMTADYQRSLSLGSGVALVADTYNSFGGPPIPTKPVSNPFNANPVLYPYGVGPSAQNADTYGAMAELDYNLGFATLTGQLGVRKYFGYNVSTSLGTATSPAPGAPASSVGDATQPSYSTTYSGEIRLASASKLPFEWVGGLFYFTEKNGGESCSHADINDPSCAIKLANPFQRTLSYAVFGQATYTPPVLDDALHLTAGGRYNLEEKRADEYTSAFFIQGGTQRLPNLQATFRAATYKLEASYDITPKSLIYVQNSTGFRAGGFAFGLTPEYKPETIMAWEAGSKNRFLDDALQVNLAAYHYIYKNQETFVVTAPPPGFPAPFADLSVQSIGKTHYTGVSADVEYAVTPDDRVALDVQYTDAHYIRFQLPPAYITSTPLGLNGLPTGETPGSQAGLRVINTPPWSGNFSYDHSLSALHGTFDGRAAIQFSDERNYLNFPTDTLQYKYGTSAPYARLDLSVSYQPDHGGWKLTGYVNNVTDTNVFTSQNYENTFGSGQVTAELLPPRTVGVILNAKF